MLGKRERKRSEGELGRKEGWASREVGMSQDVYCLIGRRAGGKKAQRGHQVVLVSGGKVWGRMDMFYREGMSEDCERSGIQHKAGQGRI